MHLCFESIFFFDKLQKSSRHTEIGLKAYPCQHYCYLYNGTVKLPVGISVTL